MTNNPKSNSALHEVGLAPSRRSVSGATVYAGRLSGQNPADLIAVRLARRSRVSLDLSKLTAGLEVQWLDRNGQTMGRSQRLSAPNTGLAGQTLKPGTYYLKLSAKAGVSSYRLSLAVRKLPAGSQRSLQSTFENQGDRFALKVLKLTNEYRRGFGLAPLRLNSVLNATAQAHSQDMAANDFFGHNGSNGSTVFDRFSQTGYRYSSGGENIAAGFSNAKSVVHAWISSSGHRANLLTPFFQEMGVGFVYLPSDPGKLKLRYYWTQDFGVPAS